MHVYFLRLHNFTFYDINFKLSLSIPPQEGGGILGKHTIVKELTLEALKNNYLKKDIVDNGNDIEYNERVAENVAAFYNKLFEKLDLTK